MPPPRSTHGEHDHRTAPDFRRLLDHASGSEGLYWLPALRILFAAAPGLLSLRGPPNSVLPYISVGPDPMDSSGFGIDFAGMLEDVDFSGPVREMVRVAWVLFSGGDPEQGSPRFDDVVCRLDPKNFQAVIEAMQLRKGTYPAPFPPPPRTEGEREAYRRRRFTDGMIDELIDEADRQARHNAAVEQVREHADFGIG